MGVINRSYDYQHIPTKAQLDFLEFVKNHDSIKAGSYYEYVIF
jgi:hypothetical protein